MMRFLAVLSCAASFVPATNVPTSTARERHDERQKEMRATKKRVEAKKIFHKTSLCRFYGHGACSRGDGCGFAHGVKELQPKLDLSRTRWCDEGENCTRQRCQFAHSWSEFRWDNSRIRGRNNPRMPQYIGGSGRIINLILTVCRPRRPWEKKNMEKDQSRPRSQDIPMEAFRTIPSDSVSSRGRAVVNSSPQNELTTLVRLLLASTSSGGEDPLQRAGEQVHPGAAQSSVYSNSVVPPEDVLLQGAPVMQQSSLPAAQSVMMQQSMMQHQQQQPAYGFGAVQPQQAHFMRDVPPPPGLELPNRAGEEHPEEVLPFARPCEVQQLATLRDTDDFLELNRAPTAYSRAVAARGAGLRIIARRARAQRHQQTRHAL